MESLIIALVGLLAGLVQGLTGFGSALVATPLLALCLDLQQVIPLVSLWGLGIGLANLIHLSRQLELRLMLPILAGAAPGIPLGIYFLRHAPAMWTEGILAITLICYASWRLAHLPINYIPGRAAAIFAGLCSGCLSGAFSAGGPPVVIYMSLQPLPIDKQKAAMIAYFLIISLVSASFYLANGMFTSPILYHFAESLPLLLLGTFLGITAYRRLSSQNYALIVHLLLLTAGLLLGSKVIWQMFEI